MSFIEVLELTRTITFLIVSAVFIILEFSDKRK